MNRTARKVAMSAAAGAVALALTSPAAVADDGDGYEGEHDGYSEEYDDSDEDSEDDDSADYYETDDESDDDAGDYSDDDHEDGDGDEHDEYDDDSDGREYDAYREAHHEDHAEESGSHSSYRGHGDGDCRHDDRHEKWGGQAAEDSDTDERESDSQTEAFTEQQTAILTHLSWADAFLADLSERISAADLDPGLKNALLGLIDERRSHLAGLVAQVRTATSWEDLKSLRDDAYGQMTEPTT